MINFYTLLSFKQKYQMDSPQLNVWGFRSNLSHQISMKFEVIILYAHMFEICYKDE